jgi:hypothetical protein
MKLKICPDCGKDSLVGYVDEHRYRCLICNREVTIGQPITKFEVFMNHLPEFVEAIKKDREQKLKSRFRV